MKRSIIFAALSLGIILYASSSVAQRMESASVEYKGQPLQSIFAVDGHVYALYGTKPYHREWVPLTTDTVKRIKMSSSSFLLSPSRDRYFYVEVTVPFPPFPDGRVAPNFDSGPQEIFGVDSFVAWDSNDIAMRLHVFRLSGEHVTTIDLPLSYCGDYAEGRWLDEHWICLNARSGKMGGNRYSLFINVNTGEKRLVGLTVRPRITPDGRFLTFVHCRIFYLDLRPVYPMYGEQLPDFGDKVGWESYKEKYFVRGEKRPFERVDEYPYHAIYQYEFTPDGKQVILLDRRPLGPQRVIPHDPLEDTRTTPPADAPPPELVFIDLDKMELTKDPKQYSTSIVLPKDDVAALERDDEKGEIRVWARDGRTVLWRASFEKLAAP